MTRAEIRQRILDGANEPDAAFVTAAQVDALIGEAAEVVAEESGAIKRSHLLALQPGVRLYSLRALSPDAMSPYRLWLVGEERRLEARSMAALDQEHERWPTVTGQPWYWYPVSWDLFGLWPAPTEGGGLLRVDTLEWPRALLDDDDAPESMEAEHDALVAYGVYDVLAKRWDAKGMLEAWSAFLRRWSDARSRSGVKRVQARDWQTGPAE